MKKIALTVLALVGLTTAAVAAENTNPHFRKGYGADVQFSVQSVNDFHITTSHGYGFGNGIYLGGGAGFGAEWEGKGVEGTPHYVPSLFVEARWSMLGSAAVSPYINLRGVQYIDLAEGATNYGVIPSIGLDMGRISFGIGYAIRKQNALQFGVGFRF